MLHAFIVSSTMVQMEVIVLSELFVFSTIICKSETWNIEYSEWTLPHSYPQKVMFCPVEVCAYPLEHWMSCCSCNSLPEWEYQKKVLGNLTVRQNSNGSYLIRENFGQSINDEVMFTGRQIITFPMNVCLFKSLVVIDFSNNWLKNIPDLSCLKWLDTLNLSRNLIKCVNLTQFEHNTNLRVLDLSHNLLWNIDPNTINSNTIVKLIFSHNYFRSYDVSNMILIERPLCVLDLSFNQIAVETLTNKLNLTIDGTKQYGSGFINLQFNKLRTVTDFIYRLGARMMTDLFKVLWRYGFDVRNNPIVCDCRMAPLMEMFSSILQVMDRNYLRVVCVQPSNMKGLTIFELGKNGLWLNMKCNLKEVDKCPRGCRCYYTLSGETSHFLWNTKTVTVNCTASNLSHFPVYVPDGDIHNLILPKNFISEFKARSYLKTTKYIDVSENNITKVEYKAINELHQIKEIVLTGNDNLTLLPESLKKLDPCVFKFPTLLLNCRCDIVWIKQWLESRKTAKKYCNSDKVFCKTETEKILIKNVNADFFQCEQSNYALYTLALLIGISVLILIGVISIVSYFRYEIFIITRKYQYPCRRIESQSFTTDLFISYDESREDIRKWLHCTLLPTLKKHGFSIYLPEISMLPSFIRSEETLNVVRNCKTFLVIFSEHYFEDGSIWTLFEWETIWRRFHSKSGHHIIPINFDLLKISDVNNRIGKAFFRVRNLSAFDDQKQNFFKDILLQLEYASVSKSDVM